ncbi:S4 domain-containing protein [Thalassospira lucentensis]|uniref:S4 domain-containing protein n=1 Tax=Thalassospira lucentensis TaxID=168935 RepID=UPI00142E88B6|nr:S4 domain-containing protein [Thalassospira lucentensis]NIZ02530.1 tyrosyl-tRNA synthetase [Thalassospira lucentensis]
MTHISVSDRTPALELAPDDLEGGIEVASLIVMAGFAKTRTEARDLVGHGAVWIEEKQIRDPEHHVLSYAFDDGEILRLSAGAGRSATIQRVG